MTTQYIGARYVPKFFQDEQGNPDWRDSIPYEPLTIVMYLGNSYTSKKYVPIGTQIDNTEYWVLTGAYNEQVEQVRREVNEYKEELDILIPQLRTIQSKKNKKYKKAIIIGDSWSVGYYDGVDHPSQGWGNYCCPLIGVTPENMLNMGSGGSGIANSTGEHYSSQILRAYNEHSDFRDADIILCLAGFNDGQDVVSTYDAVKVGCAEFYQNCNTYFPNAEIHMFIMPQVFGQVMDDHKWTVIQAINDAYVNFQVGQLCMHYGLHRWADQWGEGASAGDGSHLNQYGYNYLGQKMAELVMFGGDYYPTLNGAFDLSELTPYISDTLVNTIVEYNGIVTYSLAINVTDLPTTAKIKVSPIWNRPGVHFLDSSNDFITWDTTGLSVLNNVTGWIMLNGSFLAGY